jgi:hypothetical protein
MRLQKVQRTGDIFYHFVIPPTNSPHPPFVLPLGVRIGLFTPDRAFDMVSKAQIAKLREPSLKLVDLVTSEMMNMCKDATAKVP